MYFEVETWLGERFLCKLDIFKSIVLLCIPNHSNSLMKWKRVPKKNIIFDKKTIDN